MLHHVSVGVSDVERAAKFYDPVLATLGYKRVMEFMPYAVAYGGAAPEFWVQLPQDQNPASVGNGVHIAFNARSREAIESFHRAALAAGGKDEGAAGPRPDYGPDYYGAFARDVDGNKIEAILVREEPRAAAKRPARAKAKRKVSKARPKAKAKARAKKTPGRTARKAAKKKSGGKKKRR